MKKLVSILVLSAFLTHFTGTYIYFVVRQSQIRAEARELIGSLPSDQFEVLEFTLEEYESIKVNSHEVRIEGKMYDHSNPKIKNGKIILFARHDETEDDLISFFNEVFNTASHDNKPVPAQLLDFNNLVYLFRDQLSMNKNSSSEELIYFFLSNPIQRYYQVESPPPRT